MSIREQLASRRLVRMKMRARPNRTTHEALQTEALSVMAIATNDMSKNVVMTASWHEKSMTRLIEAVQGLRWTIRIMLGISIPVTLFCLYFLTTLPQ